MNIVKNLADIGSFVLSELRMPNAVGFHFFCVWRRISFVSSLNVDWAIRHHHAENYCKSRNDRFNSSLPDFSYASTTKNRWTLTAYEWCVLFDADDHDSTEENYVTTAMKKTCQSHANRSDAVAILDSSLCFVNVIVRPFSSRRLLQFPNYSGCSCAYMEGRHILPRFFVFLERRLCRSPNGTRPNFVTCSEVSQIWKCVSKMLETSRIHKTWGSKLPFRAVVRRHHDLARMSSKQNQK